jgi:membrane-associated phospholipid phosphatase
VNRNVNVFPSLHTSLSVTVAAMAYRTRDHYPLWAPVAAVLAASVVFSTMYLAIHWATDVVGGVVLAGLAYWGALRAPATTGSNLLDRLGERVRERS